jgi:thiamine-phosphate pyrophosphorylase
MTKLPFSILVITDHHTCTQRGRTVEAVINQLLHSPFRQRLAILVREKNVPVNQVAQTLHRLHPMVRQAGAQLLVHSHVELALAFELDGVHMASGFDLAPIRAQLSPSMILGVSRHGQDPLDELDIGFADYATMSPIYPPTSKPDDTRRPLGLAGLQACLNRAVRPLVALGGIQPGRVMEVMRLGVETIAISGALLQADDPAQMLQTLYSEMPQT